MEKLHMEGNRRYLIQIGDQSQLISRFWIWQKLLPYRRIPADASDNFLFILKILDPLIAC